MKKAGFQKQRIWRWSRRWRSYFQSSRSSREWGTKTCSLLFVILQDRSVTVVTITLQYISDLVSVSDLCVLAVTLNNASDSHAISDCRGPCGARGSCRISPPHFLAECRMRRLNQGSFVSAVCLVVCFLWFVLCLCVYFCDLYWVFSLLFVSNSQVIACEDCLQNDLYCVGWGVRLYSIQSNVSGPN